MLRKAQQMMSRKTKFSNNSKESESTLLDILARFGNARRDYMHNNTTTISQKHAMVCITRTYRDGICPSRRQEQLCCRAKTRRLSPA
jgi:hypothetical protein